MVVHINVAFKKAIYVKSRDTRARRSALNSRAKHFLTGTALCLSLVATGTTVHARLPVELVASTIGQASVGTQPQQTPEQLLELARQAQQSGNKQLAEWYSQQANNLSGEVEKTGRGLFQPFANAGEKLRRGVGRFANGRTLNSTTGKTAVIENGFVTPPSTAGSQPTRALAEQFLKKGRESLAQGNLATAAGWYKQALKSGASFEGASYTPQQLANELLAAGVNPAALQINPAAAQPAGLPSSVNSQPMAAPAGTALPSQAPAGIVNNPYVNQFTPNTGDVPAVSSLPQDAGSSVVELSPPGNAQDVVATTKAKASNLIVKAQAAITRGDLDAAQTLAEQAHHLNVPNSAFGPDEVRPWMVLLQINKARQQSRVVQAGGVSAGTNNQALYTPSNDRTQVRPAQSEAPILNLAQQGNPLTNPGAALEAAISPTTSTPAGSTNARTAPASSTPAATGQPAPTATITDQTGAEPLPVVTIPSTPIAIEPVGYDLFREGEEALKEREFDKARAAFKKAWKYEAELDAETRQRLQDHLGLLRVPNEASSAPREDLQGIEASDELRQLANEISREQAAIMRQLRQEPRGAWDRVKELRDRVANADIDELGRQRLLARVERTMTDVDNFVERNKEKIERDERNNAMMSEIRRRRQMRVEVDEKIAVMVQDFNDLMNQRRYPEAVILAKQARELDPQKPVVQNMLWKSRTAERLAMEMSLRESHRDGVSLAMQSVYSSSRPFDDLEPIVFPGAKHWESLTRNRREMFREGGAQYSETELAIQRALKTPVEVRFNEEPLAEVMDRLSQIAGVNVHLDSQGLAAEGVTSDTPVTLSLREPISLESALNLILGELSLSHVIQDEVLRITSSQTSEANVRPQVYNVADLVIPIPNFIPSYNIGLPGAIREAHNAVGYGGTVGGFNSGPMTVMAGNETLGTGTNNASFLAQMTSGGSMAGTRGSQSIGQGPGGLGGGANADFDTLIELITTTIAPTTWDLVGGPGSIAPFPTNLSLVVSQTQDVHDDIRDLLQQLRRLQDLQVTIEVRFITLNDRFFERIGVDFDFDIDNNVDGLTGADVEQLASGPRATIGIDPATGLPTADLDIQFSQGSFGSTAPQFGGFDVGTAANFGFAILSDIEAFFVIEAAQGDTRTNVLQAPKVTLFNGQQAFVSDTSQRPFVTSVIPVVGDFAAAHQPVIVVLSEGTSLSVQAVVSPDRRFVRLTLVPFFSQIGDVEEFTFDGRRTSNSGTTGVDPTDDTQTVVDNAEEIIEGTTVQLPTFSFTTVTTTVSVPDGGTILLGGIKRLSEGRNERGVPMLSKLPYINRLFKNVGIGRETQSLMMMVTPRIIIQEEEEEKLGIAPPTN